MADNTPKRDRHEPSVMVETGKLSNEEWLAYRRRGIGGSDVAAILGISPFRTARDIYYDKLNIASAEDDTGNWVALEMGHLLEDLVAKIFQKKTGLEIYQVKKMFCHPQYRFMLADVDYFVKLPDGGSAILEIKTTNYNARDRWWKDGEAVVPPYYETQGRHYMAVMDLDKAYFCCLYGNTEDEVIVRELNRDFSYEDEMLYLEQDFWEQHVMKKLPPPYTEDGTLIIESSRRHFGPADLSAPAVELKPEITSVLMQYLKLQEEKRSSEKYSKKLEQEMLRLRGMMIAEMGTSCTAMSQKDGLNYVVTYNPVRKTGIDKDGLLRLELLYPEIYKQFVSVSESRRFQIKISAADAA